MKLIDSLSEKEKNLIFALFIVVILIISYQLGFVHFSNKTDILYSENTKLNEKLEDLLQKAENKEKYIEETEQMNQEVSRMLDYLPATISEEKSTLFVTELEEKARMNISAITYGEVSEVYSLAKNEEAADVTEGTDSGAETEDISSDQGSSVESTGEQEKEEGELKGYKSNITINYQTDYAGLKSAIDYINQNREKMCIQSLTAAFDNTTGNLAGTLSYDVFEFLFEGREAEPVYIDGVNTGKDNIFGTFELPGE